MGGGSSAADSPHPAQRHLTLPPLQATYLGRRSEPRAGFALGRPAARPGHESSCNSSSSSGSLSRDRLKQTPKTVESHVTRPLANQEKRSALPDAKQAPGFDRSLEPGRDAPRHSPLSPPPPKRLADRRLLVNSRPSRLLCVKKDPAPCQLAGWLDRGSRLAARRREMLLADWSLGLSVKALHLPRLLPGWRESQDRRRGWEKYYEARHPVC